MRVLLSLALFAALEGAALARGYQDLGTLERQTVDDALFLRGLTLEPQPEGKTIGAVLVVNLDVFSSRDYFFQFFNRFHWTTQEEMIRREALFRAGQPYDQNLIDETARNLENPVYTSALGIVAVKSPNPGMVDVLIVTRDLWSLRFNTNFEYQQGKLVALTASLAENNLFGWRKSLALVSLLDQNRLSLGPTYVDPNIAGTRLTATGYARVNIGRDNRQTEGYDASGQVSYPLFSLASKWGAGIRYDVSRGVQRIYQGTEVQKLGLDCFKDLDGKTVCPVVRGRVYRYRTQFGLASITRRLAFHGVYSDVSAGYRLSVSRQSLPANFPADPPGHPTITAQFIQGYMPPSQLSSSVFASLGSFKPRYRIYRDLNTFDLRETAALGPSLALSVRQAARALGSDRDFTVFSAGANWSTDLFDGFQSMSLGWSSRWASERGWTDENFSGNLTLISPVIARALRVVAAAGTSILLDDTQNAFSALGGDTGLRGYAIGDFLGKSVAVAHVEVRSMALSILSLRAGGLVFYDVGDAATPEVAPGSTLGRAWATLMALRPHQGMGVGLRILIPQFNTYVLRADWAFATDNTPYTRAGWPGRFSAGFSQAF